MRTLSSEPSNLTPGMQIRLVQPDHIDYPFLISITPPSMDPPEGGFCGVVSTDGNFTGGTVNQAFFYGGMEMSVPPTVAISIGYPLEANPPAMLARNTDLTPTPWPAWDTTYAKILGGDAPVSGSADAFRDFISDELIPDLGEEFSIRRDQWSLIGHSLGGLFTTYFALTRPSVFRRYLAVGSSYWWRDREIFEQVAGFSGLAGSGTRALYVAAGTGEGSAAIEMDWQKFKGQKAWEDYMKVMGGFPDIWGDGQRMAQEMNNKEGFVAKFESIDNETHGTAVLTALSRGIRWLHSASNED